MSFIDCLRYAAVATKFLNSVGRDVRVHKIERVENRNLWNKFATELAVKDLNPPYSILEEGGRGNPQLLFHGTTGTNPRIILDSHEGLDLRFNGKNRIKFG